MNKLYQMYAKLFAKPSFYKWNYHLYRLALSGLGILNFNSSDLSGEKYFIESFLPQFVHDDPILFDVGANVGCYSKELIKTFPSARLHVFEPHPKNYNQIKKAGLPAHTIFNNMGISDQIGSISLYDYQENDGSTHASMYKGVIEDIHHSQSVAHDVKTDTIDHYIQSHEINYIDLLKIDVEGHEYEVLKGATKAIQSAKIGVIHFEFNEMNVESRVFFKDIYDLLNQYSVFRMLPSGMLPLDNYWATTHEIFAYQNIVAIHEDLNY